MTQLPFMPVAVERLLADTDHLTNEEFGAYVRLLCHGWLRKARLPRHDMPVLAHVSPHRWPYLWRRLAGFFFEVEGGLFSQNYLRKSLELAHRNNEANKARTAKARAQLAKKNKGALNNDRSVTEPVTEVVTMPVTMPVTETMTEPATAPQPEKGKALPSKGRELYPSAPSLQTMDEAAPANGAVEGSALAGERSLEGRSPPEPSEEGESAEPPHDPELVKRLVEAGIKRSAKATGLMAAIEPKEDDDAQDQT